MKERGTEGSSKPELGLTFVVHNSLAVSDGFHVTIGRMNRRLSAFACMSNLNNYDCRNASAMYAWMRGMFLLDLAFLAAFPGDPLIHKSRGSPANAGHVLLWLSSRYLDLSCRSPFSVYFHMLLPTPALNAQERNAQMLPSCRWLAGRLGVSTIPQLQSAYAFAFI